jgi:hypothetical protein
LRRLSSSSLAASPRPPGVHFSCLIYSYGARVEKKFWQPIGAMWAHADANGFNLRIDYLPLNDADRGAGGQLRGKGGAQPCASTQPSRSLWRKDDVATPPHREALNAVLLVEGDLSGALLCQFAMRAYTRVYTAAVATISNLYLH